LRESQTVDEPDPFAPYLVEVTPDNWGGTRSPGCHLYVAALNYTPPDVILVALAETRWRRPSEVQVLIMDQFEDCFTTYVFRHGAWLAFGPGKATEE
jgi:hypothetical protein